MQMRVVACCVNIPLKVHGQATTFHLIVINKCMPNITINVKKWYAIVLAILPLVGAISTGVMWIDTRYMHKEISDTRFIELQIKIIEGHIKDYNRILDAGGTLSAEDQIRFEMDREQLKDLTKERNRILGIGEMPQ